MSDVAKFRKTILERLEGMRHDLKKETMEALIKALNAEGGIRALEDKSRRPKKVSEKNWDTELKVSIEG